MSPRHAFLRGLLVCGLGCDIPTEAQAPHASSPSAALSAQLTLESSAPAPPPTRELRAPMVRLGRPAFGTATFVATSPDGTVIASSMGMAGARVELVDGNARPLRTLSVDVEQAVRALDFSADGKSLLLSLTGTKQTEVKVVRVSDGQVLRSVSLPREDGGGLFTRGPEGRFLADDSFVAWSGGRVLHYQAAGEPRALAEAPQGVFCSTSMDRRWLLIATPDGVSARQFDKPAKEVWRRKRTAQSAQAFIDEDGSALFDDAGAIFLRGAKGAELRLGEGRPVGLSREVAVFHREDAHEVVERKGQRRSKLPGARGFLAASGKTLFANSGADELNALTPVPVDEVLAGRTALFGAKPWYLGFTHRAHELLVLDREDIVRWDTVERRVRERVPLPDRKHRGIFRTATDVFVLAGVAHRLVDDELEEVGRTWTGNPRAAVRADGSTVVCVSDALQRCQGHFVFEPSQTRLGEFAWGYLFPFSNGVGFMEGPYQESGSDLGIGKMHPHEEEQALDETWLTDVDLWWAAPTGDGGIIVTKEGRDRLARTPFLRRVGERGLGNPCALSIQPSRDAGIAVAPDGRTVAVPGYDRNAQPLDPGAAVHVVDVDTCETRARALPARAISVDIAPSGAELAIGLEDRTIAVLQLE